METSKTIHREHSLSFEGVGRNQTNTESVRLETGLNFRVFLRLDMESREKALGLILFALYNFLKWFFHDFPAAV